MNSYERQSAIMDILCRDRHTTASELASKFDVTMRTIRNDITALSLRYPLQTVRGRYGGGVQLADWFQPQAKTLAPEQRELLHRISPTLTGKDVTVLNSILLQFDSLQRLQNAP